MQDFMSQMDYIVSHRDRTFNGVSPSEQQIDAIQRRFTVEQEERNTMMQKTFMKAIGVKRKNIAPQASNAYIRKRLENAKWHISCYSTKDKQWVDLVMKEFDFDNYVTYKTIDECINDFKI